MPIMTRSASLTDYEPVARGVGLDPFRMLRIAGLPARVLDDPNMLISAHAVGLLLEQSARISGQEAFGLLLAETRSIANLGMIALVIREEPTLHAALHSCVRYMRLQNAGVQLQLEDAGDVAILHVHASAQGAGAQRQFVEMSIGIGLRILRVLSRDRFQPLSVALTHDAPMDITVHRRVLGEMIEFGQEWNGVVCESRELDRPITAADPALNREVKRLLDLQLAGHSDEPVQRARQVVRMLLPSGLCTVERIAQHMGMHRRTLNRHLAQEGQNVTAIINDVRAEMAQEYLTASRRRFYEIAELLGFASAGDFSRWFRIRFGQTPSDWASMQRSPDGPQKAT